MTFSFSQLSKYTPWITFFLVFTTFQSVFLYVFFPISRPINTFKTRDNLLDQVPTDTNHCVCDVLPSGNSILIPTYPVRGPLPWNVINEEMKAAYTLNGAIKVEHMYLFEDSYSNPGDPIVYKGHLGSKFVNEWSKSEINKMVTIVKQRDPQNVISSYGPIAEKIFHTTLQKYPVKDLSVLVIGSQRPWLESFCIAYGAGKVTTVDFNVPQIEDKKMIRGISIGDLAKSQEKFDAIFSYSSLEHDGLGRYGDPLNPYGDIERLKRIKSLVSPHGKLYLGVPMGSDTLVWNAHRVYGRVRFTLLIQGWKLVETVGFYDFDKFDPKGEDQPIHVLELNME